MGRNESYAVPISTKKHKKKSRQSNCPASTLNIYLNYINEVITSLIWSPRAFASSMVAASE